MDGVKETWWAAIATFKATHPENPRRRNLWERTTFLVRAEGRAAAEAAALDLARGKQHAYQSASGGLVCWTLGELEQVKEIMDAELGPGTEVASEFYYKVDRVP